MRSPRSVSYTHLLQTNNAIACMGAEPKKVLEALLRLEFNVCLLYTSQLIQPVEMASATAVSQSTLNRAASCAGK